MMATMAAKLLTVFCTFLIFFSVKAESNEENDGFEILAEKYLKVEPHIFESNIFKVLKLLKEILKYGHPEMGFPSLDPFFMAKEEFDFVLNDTALKGYFENVTVYKFSDFEPTDVEFKLLPFHLKIGIFLKELHIDGRYKLLGNLLGNIPINATGKFISETGNLSLSLYIRPIKVNSSLQIKELKLDFKALSEKVNYTNEYESDEFQVLDEKFALDILDQIQEKYIPPLLNTGKIVVNHFLLGYSFDDIMKFILNLINKTNIFDSLF